MEEIIIVDEHDNEIGTKPRDRITTDDIYRVSALWIINLKGELLLSKRSKKKIQNPLKWGPSVSGTVAKGETYYSNIIKEAKEELGITGIKPQKGPKLRNKREYDYFAQWYILNVADIEIHPNDEVAQTRWFPKHVLIEEYNKNPDEFLGSIKDFIELFS